MEDLYVLVDWNSGKVLKQSVSLSDALRKQLNRSYATNGVTQKYVTQAEAERISKAAK